MKKKGKVISFPNKIVKKIKDRLLYGETEEYTDKVERGPKAKLFDGESMDSMILFPVRYSYESRYETYYFMTRVEDHRITFDTSNYIKVPLDAPLAEPLWKYPTEGSTTTQVEMNNLEYLGLKYAFVHVNNEHRLLQTTKTEEAQKFIEYAYDFDFVHEIVLGNGEKITFSDKPNKFGLIGNIEPENMLHVLSIDHVKSTHFEYVLTVYDLSVKKKRHLVRTKLDNGITYKDGETNFFINLQKYLFREVKENELPSKY